MTIASSAHAGPDNLDAVEAFMEYPAALAQRAAGTEQARARDEGIFGGRKWGVGTIVEFLAQDVAARHLLAVDRAFSPLFRRASADTESGSPAGTGSVRVTIDSIG